MGIKKFNNFENGKNVGILEESINNNPIDYYLMDLNNNVKISTDFLKTVTIIENLLSKYSPTIKCEVNVATYTLKATFQVATLPPVNISKKIENICNTVGFNFEGYFTYTTSGNTKFYIHANLTVPGLKH